MININDYIYWNSYDGTWIDFNRLCKGLDRKWVFGNLIIVHNGSCDYLVEEDHCPMIFDEREGVFKWDYEPKRGKAKGFIPLYRMNLTKIKYCPADARSIILTLNKKLIKDYPSYWNF